MAIRNALPFEFPYRWPDLRRFFGKVPDEAADFLDQRDRDLEDFLAGLGGGGGYAATVTVAASDAADTTKERCDFVCDGTDDEGEINLAQDICFELAEAGGYATDRYAPGGRVLLSEGTFNIGNTGIDSGSSRTGYFAGPPNLTLQGQGKSATRLDHAGTGFAVISYGYGYTLRDLTVDSSGGTGGLGTYLEQDRCDVERVRFIGGGSSGDECLHMRGDRVRVTDCDFIEPQSDDALLLAGEGAMVSGCHFELINQHAIYPDTIQRYHVITGCTMLEVQMSGASTNAFVIPDRSVAIGNVCVGNLATATIGSGASCQVANNVLL